MQIVPLTPATADAWSALFDASGCSCFCRWWHFSGSKNDWLARCAHEPHVNRGDELEALRSGSLEARGLLALEGDEAAGWMKLAPRAALPKLLRQGAYRALDLGSDDGIWSIGCLLVRPDRRRTGVARCLVEGAVAWVGAWGGRCVEAYPRGAGALLHDEEAWMGTADLFASCGFVRVAGEPAYPVMRRDAARQPTTSPAD